MSFGCSNLFSFLKFESLCLFIKKRKHQKLKKIHPFSGIAEVVFGIVTFIVGLNFEI